MPLAHQLVQGIVRHGTPHEVLGINRWTGRPIPGVPLRNCQSSFRIEFYVICVNWFSWLYIYDYLVGFFKLVLITSVVCDAIDSVLPGMINGESCRQSLASAGTFGYSVLER